MAKTLLMSGFDLVLAELPDEAQLLLPAAPLPELEDFRAAAARAFEEPAFGPPLSQRVRPGSRVTVVLDDFTLPVPPASRDCRREMLEVTLRELSLLGVSARETRVLVANGLSRKWRAAELGEVLGPELAARAAIECHDAEDSSQLSRLGEEPEGLVELNRAVVEADLVIHLNVVTLPAMAGTFGLISGLAGYRTARFLAAPALFEDKGSPWDPGSPFQRVHRRVAAHLLKTAPVLQLAVVLNNALWNPALAELLRSSEGLARPLQVWNALPNAVRHRAARLLRASYRPFFVVAGEPDKVAPGALESFYRQHQVTADGEVDVLAFGLPDHGPFSVRGAQNPVLAASLALGYVANLFSGRPLLKQGGVLIFANPLQPAFDRRAHLPHEEFYEKVLRLEKEPSVIAERFEPYFAGRPEFVANYQRRFAFHGAHPLFAWALCQPARRRAGKIIAAHGDPRACARLGLTPAKDLEDALEKARGFLDIDRPRVAVLELPPPFWVRA